MSSLLVNFGKNNPWGKLSQICLKVISRLPLYILFWNPIDFLRQNFNWLQTVMYEEYLSNIVTIACWYVFYFGKIFGDQFDFQSVPASLIQFIAPNGVCSVILIVDV